MMSIKTVGIQPVHKEAARLIAAGQRPSDVAARLNLDSDDLREVMGMAKRMQAAQTPTLPTPPRPPAQPKPLPPAVPVAAPPPAVAPKRAVVLAPDTLEELLAWAETDGPSRARTLAARVRAAARDLTALHARHTATAEERAFVAALERQLADAKARLRALEKGDAAAAGRTAAPVAAPPVAAPDDAARRAAIRAWARTQGLLVPDRGRIPGPIIAAFEGAHPDGGA